MFDDGDDGAGNVFRDMLFIMMFGFAFMVYMMLPFLNPPAKEDQTEPPGNVIVNIMWPTGMDVDVDLWVHGPNEISPVGYSNKSGVLWSLLRDDTGTGVDVNDLNFENAYTRGIIPGEYIVNIHCYRCSILPVPVNVEVSVKREDATVTGNASISNIIETKAVLRQQHEELTIIRFKLTEEGHVVPGSLNHVYRPLRAKDSAGLPGGLRGREGATP